ncbi:IBR domain containing protein [Panicum miliaceum]|uniref:IBR domain containing protein n=1 Tax=Panicum miliaceum TaxID=4540 RepID=A0A3L6SNC9_PANMI|nr:IBR domain containing protein [Panicum miliaceum]
MTGDDDLATLREQIALASSAAISASDLDHAFQLQLAEAIQASLVSGPNAAAASSSSQAAPALPVPESSSDAAYAFAVQAADLARAEQDGRDAEACRAAHARAAASARVAAHDALFARELAAIPEDQWAHDGDYFERPLESDKSRRPLFRVFSKGMASREVVGPRDRDPSVAVLAAAAGRRGRCCSGYTSRWSALWAAA